MVEGGNVLHHVTRNSSVDEIREHYAEFPITA